MKLPLLSKKSKKSEPDIPFAGFEFNDTEVTVFIANHQESINLTYTDEISTAVNQLLESASIATGIMPKQVVAGISGISSQGTMAVVRFNRASSEQPITDREMKKIRASLTRAALEEAETEVIKAFNTDSEDLGLINSQEAYLKVDEFLSNDPVGLKGKAVEIAFCNIFAQAEIISNIEKAFKKKKIELLTITDCTAAQLSFIPKEYHAISDYLTLVEAGKSFDLAVVFSNKIISTRTLPLGRSFADTQPDLFIKALQETLASFEGIKTFPSTIVFFGKPLNIEKQLVTHPWSRYLPFQSSPKVVNIERGLEGVFPKVVRALR